MAEIFINGLYFNKISNRGTTVNLFDNQSSDNSFGNLIFSGQSDNLGHVKGEIENRFIGKKIIMEIIEPGFVPLQTKLDVTELGIFYTVKLDFDRSYSGSNGIISSGSEWSSLEFFNKSQTELQAVIRKFKFQNFGIKYAHYFIILISIILGLIATFPYNLISAIFFPAIGELLGPFVIGLKPFWRRG
jgi:hypothetical protein